MGLFDFLRRLLGFAPPPSGREPIDQSSLKPDSPSKAVEPLRSVLEPAPAVSKAAAPVTAKRPWTGRKKDSRHPTGDRKPVSPLPKLRYRSNLVATPPEREICKGRPYRFAWIADQPELYRNLSLDSDQRWLDYFDLPVLKTPDDLAAWLGIKIGTLAWLAERTPADAGSSPLKQSHYFYHFRPKKSGGFRLIESPKTQMKQVQEKILREILDQIPPHAAAHGFVAGRSILTNAEPHVGQRLVMKFDLQDFYATVRYSRVVSIFRSVGYCREIAIWLARLTTNAIPWNLPTPGPSWEKQQYLTRHLPQGAPTSPALANLSAFGLDVRLQGLAAAYDLSYTRYADDLTFSGPGVVIPALSEVIPLIEKIIHAERFRSKGTKRRILRNCQRQSVAGVVVNEKLNVSRRNYDALKAILHNCRRHGPSTQKRDVECDFAAHLLGRIAHIQQLNPQRGQKLRMIYDQINWSQ